MASTSAAGTCSSTPTGCSKSATGWARSAWLGVAADGRYDLGTALAMAHFYEEDVGIDWIDTPLPPTTGWAVSGWPSGWRCRWRSARRSTTGTPFGGPWRPVLSASLRPDPLRLGGITPLVKVATLAEAFHVCVVPCRLPEVGVHLGLALSNVPMAEWGSWLAGALASRSDRGRGSSSHRTGPGTDST